MSYTSENKDDKYRNIVRSKILKRIYERNNFIENEPSNVDNDIERPLQFTNDQVDVLENSENTINQKIRRQLSNEWRKTLERVLNYRDGYLDGKLEVTRKDAVRFFINTHWPEDIESESELDDNNNENKKKKDKSKKRKQKHLNNRAVEIIPEYDPNKLLVIRCSKIPWKQMNSSKIPLNSILTDEFFTDHQIIDEDLLEELQKFIRFKTISRLFREKIDLGQFVNIDFVGNYQERFLLQESHRVFSQDLMFNRFDLAHKSKFYKFLSKTLNFFFNIIPNEDELNNRSFMLSIGSIKLDFSKHPCMNSEDKIVKKLILCFRTYQKLFSNKTKQKLDKLQQQINAIVGKLENIDNDKMSKEVFMALNLLQRLLKQHDQLILNRRRSLIDLIQEWSQFQNNLDKFESADVLNEIDLKLDEIENVDIEQERTILNQIISKRIEIQNLMEKIQNRTNLIENDKIKENLYLDDGRLPGEPKFNLIELILPQIFQKTDFSLNIFYSIEILIGNKIILTFENSPLNCRSFSSSWNDHYRSFPFPMCLESTYMSSIGDTDENFVTKFLPKIRIQEKNQGGKISKIITEIQLNSLPSLIKNSIKKSMKIEKNFQDIFEENKKKPKFEGTIEFQMYWSSFPSNKVDKNSNSSSDLFWMYDEDKRRIKLLENLDEIDQWLYDIRYHVNDSIIYDDDDDNDYHYYRQIGLIQLLLRQKYHLELSALYQEKEQLNKLSKLKNEEEKQAYEEGTFCSDQEIELNKRFQMMIERNKGHRNYRFIPLTNTDLLLYSDLRNDDIEKSSDIVLLEFIKTSCEKHIDRMEDQSDVVTISHDWCGDDRIRTTQWFILGIRLLHKIWEHSIKLDNITDNEKVKEIVSLEEIVKEATFDTISMSFPLINFFQPSTARRLNPSRKNRHKEAINILGAIESDLQVHLLVQHASNVPLKIINNNNSNNENYSKNLDLSPCSTFVEIKIDNNNQTMCTSISDGTQPSWNESFKFKIKLNPKNNINLNLFAVTKNYSDRDADSVKYEEFDWSNNDNSKLERYWLGQLKIPLSLLLFVSKLEGSFNLFSPYFINNYKSLNKSNHLFNLDSNSKSQSINDEEPEKLPKNVNKVLSLYSKDGTEYSSMLGSLPDIRLSLFVTTDPPIESNITTTPNHQSLETIELIDYCERWLQPLHNRFPKRRFVCLVNNLQYKSLLAIRFLAPLKPPTFEELSPIKLDLKTDEKKSKLNKLVHKESLYISLIIRYVSLIPSLFELNINYASEFCSRFIDRWSKSNIWLDAVQFLTFRIGCQVEHAILLCCFLLYLDKKAYLVLGTGLLEGPTAYVLVYPGSDFNDREEGTKNSRLNLVLIDPKRGKQFFVQDYNCTMISVDCIITPDNIFANIQKSSHPSLISYNLQRSTHWQPLFSYKNQTNFHNLDLSIQPQSINYCPINVDWAEYFEVKVETFLREQFMNWRRLQTGSYTPFNRFYVHLIKQLLPELERHSVLNGHRCYLTKLAQIEEMIVKELNRIDDVHKMIGYPMNVVTSTGMDFDQLSRLIYSTNLHLAHFGCPNQVEYAIACYVHPYPSNIYSIWIYIAALASKSIVSSSS